MNSVETALQRQATAAETSGPTIPITRSTTVSPKTKHSSAGLAQDSFAIFIANLTTTTFDGVNLGVFRHSAPGLQVLTQGPLTPLSLFVFELANCSDIRQYAFHVILNGEIAGRSGDVTPDDTDGDLCSDVWDLG
jgi:hypothetical protein